jgi:hypothetical protein
MLLHIRSFRPTRGKNTATLAWAKEVASVFDKSIGPARPTEVLTELFGENGRIYWLVWWQDWTQYERWRAWTRTDQAWAALAKQSVEQDLTIEDSWKDVLLETT